MNSCHDVCTRFALLKKAFIRQPVFWKSAKPIPVSNEAQGMNVSVPFFVTPTDKVEFKRVLRQQHKILKAAIN
jgi:hypothetical protein